MQVARIRSLVRKPRSQKLWGTACPATPRHPPKKSQFIGKEQEHTVYGTVNYLGEQVSHTVNPKILESDQREAD